METLNEIHNNSLENLFIIKSYVIYIPVVIALTVFVAHNLFKSGRTFMMDIFNGRQEIAFATNRLFKVGFYLFNIGYALLVLKISQHLAHNQAMVEILSLKIGSFAIFLGVMLFLNLFMFFRGKKVSSQRRRAMEEIKAKTIKTFEGNA